MKYICKNPKCEAFNTEATIYNERITFKEGKSMFTGAPCPTCGELRKPINPIGMTTHMRGIDGPKT
jgi:hypothetical protein